MKIADVKALSDAELHTRIAELKQEKLNLRIQQQSGRLERPSRLTEIRKTIARIQTVLSQRRLSESAAAK
ncbi:MAG: 50S ribosomal protein L29 [Verrucomicrobiales bacterium]|jgi:large subunit ribosomal protein L29|nr:50S ribosomal protein L29 [Verrucomicrobiales bacterium]